MNEGMVVDTAGAFDGGAARFLYELKGWIEAGTLNSKPTLIGQGKHLSPSWLLQREALARGAKKTIALNNASFFVSGDARVALLRNALHFAEPAELQRLNFRPSRSLRAQIPVIRALARRADTLVVPCSAMAERVVNHAPHLANRVVVRHHPVSPPKWAGSESYWPNTILVPIIPHPYKNLGAHLDTLLSLTEDFTEDVRLYVTARPRDLPELASNPRVEWLGTLPTDKLDAYRQQTQAVYFPTGLESFGYPLAEARAGGRFIIAQDSAQNREIAKDALCGFSMGNAESLRHAVGLALTGSPPPDLHTFDPNSYFNWLFDHSSE